MKRLQELILELEVLSVDQINQAIFSYPEFGLVESVFRQYGEETEEKILLHLSSSLGVELLEGSALEVDESLLLEKAIEIAPLIEELRAIPLRLQSSGAGQESVLLAMANPLDSRAREAFRRVLQRPIETLLAREREIKLAAASVAGKLGLKAREDSQVMSETVLGSLTRYVEDPEVRKAVQQLTATAVKHAVRNIQVDLGKAYVEAQFSFEDSRSSSVEISINPLAMLTTLLRKGQVLRRERELIEVESRVSFKSSAVDLRAEVRFQVEDSSTLGVPLELTLSRFRVDSPDNPLFWQGLDTGNAERLRSLFDAPSGLFVVASKDDRARTLALRSLKQSFNDVHFADSLEELSDENPLFATAEKSRVLLGLKVENMLDATSMFEKLSQSNRNLLRGIMVYYAVPAICPCCSSTRAITAEEQESIPEWASLPETLVAYGVGCAVCHERGALGVLGVSSVLDMRSAAGRSIRKGGSRRDVAIALVTEALESVSENGMNRIASGRTSFIETLQTIPEMPEELLYAAEEQRNGNLEVSESSTEDEEIDLTLAPDEDFPDSGASTQDLITGRGVFASSSSHKAVNFDSFDDFTLRDEEESIASVVEEAKTKPETVEEPKTSAIATLLVIDDDPDQRSILRKVFELEGYKVETASDGVDGIVSANRVHPTVIIVDFMMPELDGRETIQRLKGSPATSTIPIVALTAYADPDVEYGLLKAGADDFCAKSVSKKVLLRRVERLLPESTGS